MRPTVLAVLLTLSSLAGSTFAQESAGTSEFYPTRVGTEWVFKSGPLELTERIAAREKINGEDCLRVETLHEGKVVAYEHIAVRPDGVYRVSIAGTEVTPPLCFLKYSAKLGDAWSVQSRVQGTEVSGKFTLGQATVRLPAGEYRAVTSQGTGFKAGEESLEFTYYFVSGMGKVQQVIKANGQEAVLALKEFRAPR